MGLRIGYGLNRIVTPYFGGEYADIRSRGLEAFDRMTFAHVDLGVRLHLAGGRRRWVPYGDLALTGGKTAATIADSGGYSVVFTTTFHPDDRWACPQLSRPAHRGMLPTYSVVSCPWCGKATSRFGRTRGSVSVGALIFAAALAVAAVVGLLTWFRARSDSASPSSDRICVRPDAPNVSMRAKDWQPLREAFEVHVRSPLKEDASTNDEWRQLGIYPLDIRRGQVSATSDGKSTLSYTLLYACMHFDALCMLMDTQEWRDPVSATLRHDDDPSVLHVDFGCGPGTASWAVMNALSRDVRVTTIGYDHNPYMIHLARAMTAHVGGALTKACLSEFLQDWDEFSPTVLAHCDHHWNAVIVTANSLFGQDAMRQTDIAAVVNLIIEICGRTPELPVFVVGTHPPYSEARVADAWRSISRIPGANWLYDDRLIVVSGNPRRYDAPAWTDWTPPAQLGHAIQIVGDGERG